MSYDKGERFSVGLRPGRALTKEQHGGPFLACPKMYEFRLPTFLMGTAPFQDPYLIGVVYGQPPDSVRERQTTSSILNICRYTARGSPGEIPGSAAAGNLTSNGSGPGTHTYFYDAENRLIEAPIDTTAQARIIR